MASNLLVFVARSLMIALFLPFSALDKIYNFAGAVDQARQIVSHRSQAALLIGAGFAIEVVMSLAVLTGIADRLAAVVLAGYCLATAIIWKPFWKQAGFRLRGKSDGREMFWDFLKNLSLAGGFLILACGGTVDGVRQLVAEPLGSTHPYSHTRVAP